MRDGLSGKPSGGLADLLLCLAAVVPFVPAAWQFLQRGVRICFLPAMAQLSSSEHFTPPAACSFSVRIRGLAGVIQVPPFSILRDQYMKPLASADRR